MKVTFLAHSGFFIELDRLCLLFDWWKGELPSIPAGKPLLVFASHNHGDHFKPEIFALDDGSREIHFLLGKDIHLNPAHRAKWELSDTTFAKCTRLGGDQTLEPVEGVRVETLRSTDAGVAFLVTVDGTVIYHAGDLNWWHWEGEPDPWNPDMERNFKAYLEPLRDRSVDLAMVPLDSRLGDAEDWGLAWYLNLTHTRRVLPMHQWGDFSPTGRFLEKYPQWADRITPIHRENEFFLFDEKGDHSHGR